MKALEIAIIHFPNDQVLNFLSGAEVFLVINTQGVAEAVELFKKKHNDDKALIHFPKYE